MKVRKLAIAVSLAVLATPVLADINIGMTIAATGPAAALGVPQKNTATLFPTTIAGEKINWIVLDDGTDPTNAAKNANKFVNEDKVDVMVGTSTVAGSMAVVEVAVSSKTPLVSLAPIELPAEKHKWVFRMPQHNSLMAKALIEHMNTNKVKTLGFIGFADPYGDSWLKELTAQAQAAGINIVATERYARADTSVTGQVVKLLAAKPDAVFIAGSGSPAVLPQTTLVERGYKGAIYQSHGAVGKDPLRVGGKAMEGSFAVSGPLLVWDQLPDSHPSKKAGGDYDKKYEDKFGAGSMVPQGGHAWDAAALIARAIPVALKKAKPGTPEFRAAMRDALESEKDVVGVHGVFNMNANDHFGHDARGRVIVKVENGQYKLVK